MPMMENRVTWIIGILILIVFLNVVEWGFANTFTDSDGYVKEGDISSYEGVSQKNVDRGWEGLNLFAPVFNFLTISIAGLPAILLIFLNLIYIISLAVGVYVIITVILDAAPWTGG